MSKNTPLIHSYMSSQRFSVDDSGHYGPYGGRYAPEVLIPALEELESCFNEAKEDPAFIATLEEAYRNFIGRPTPFLHLGNLSRELGGAQIYLKNEGAAYTGAHKINHCVGQVLLAKRMGKTRIVADTGAGQHGLATATVSAQYGLECTIYMGARDIARQRPNVFWMEQLGAQVESVEFGGKRLKDAINASLKDWITNVRNTHFLLGSCLGPHPYPEINRFFQRIIGCEVRRELELKGLGLPDYVIACVGGGSNAMGIFDAFLDEPSVKLIGIEGGGIGKGVGQHAARFEGGRQGIVEGYRSYFLLDEHGQVADTHSISAGLDYPGIGPLHALMRDKKRAEYASASDKEVLSAFTRLSKTEGIRVALESAHAVAHAIKLAP